MKIAILSDIHDHVKHLKIALRDLPREVEQIICCGDLCSPFMITLLAKNFSGDIHVVFGNNDGDLFRISQVAYKFPKVYLHGEIMELHLANKKIIANHFPEIALPIAHSQQYDLVCYGHNHQYSIERIASTWLVNPGTLMAYTPLEDRDLPATLLVYDTILDAFQKFSIADGQLILEDN